MKVKRTHLFLNKTLRAYRAMVFDAFSLRDFTKVRSPRSTAEISSNPNPSKEIEVFLSFVAPKSWMKHPFFVKED